MRYILLVLCYSEQNDVTYARKLTVSPQWWLTVSPQWCLSPGNECQPRKGLAASLQVQITWSRHRLHDEVHVASSIMWLVPESSLFILTDVYHLGMTVSLQRDLLPHYKCKLRGTDTNYMMYIIPVSRIMRLVPESLLFIPMDIYHQEWVSDYRRIICLTTSANSMEQTQITWCT